MPDKSGWHCFHCGPVPPGMLDERGHTHCSGNTCDRILKFVPSYRAEMKKLGTFTRNAYTNPIEVKRDEKKR